MRYCCSWGEKADRQYTPRPAEVRAEILRRLPPEPRQLLFSIGACEMEATVIVLKRDGEVTREAVKLEMERILTDRRERGYTITGGDLGGGPIKVFSLAVADEIALLGYTDCQCRC